MFFKVACLASLVQLRLAKVELRRVRGATRDSVAFSTQQVFATCLFIIYAPAYNVCVHFMYFHPGHNHGTVCQ